MTKIKKIGSFNICISWQLKAGNNFCRKTWIDCLTYHVFRINSSPKRYIRGNVQVHLELILIILTFWLFCTGSSQTGGTGRDGHRNWTNNTSGCRVPKWRVVQVYVCREYNRWKVTDFGRKRFRNAPRRILACWQSYGCCSQKRRSNKVS